MVKGLAGALSDFIGDPAKYKAPTVRPLVRLKKFHKKIQTNLEDAEAGVAMSDVGF